MINSICTSKRIFVIICIPLLCKLIFSQTTNEDLMLEYSVLHRVQGSEIINPLEIGDTIKTADELRINAQFKKHLTCYIIYEAPNQNVEFLFNSTSNSKKNSEIYFHTTDWLQFSLPVGVETIYFILSHTRLTALEKLVKDIGLSSGGRAKKFYKRFNAEIDKLSSPNNDSTHLTTRLDKPIVGGVTFRGKEDEINGYSLTHEIKKNNTDVIIETFILQHQ